MGTRQRSNSKPTIYDVASAAGVSSATVSRVMSGRNAVAESTREHVMGVARSMGYRANSIARSLSSQTSDMVAVLVPDISNPFFSELVKGVQSAAFREGFTTLICNTEGDPKLERSYLDVLIARQVRHVFVVGLMLDRIAVQEYVSAGLDFVALDRPMRHASSALVHSQNRQGAEAAVRHLIELGHRRIAHIAGPPEVALSGARRRGYLQALEVAGIDADDALVAGSDFSAPGGAAAFAELQRRGGDFTAIFAADDIIAIGALSAALTAGRSVPGDLSLVGFDDVPLARFTLPPLTTVHQDAAAMSKRAVELISTTSTGKKPRRYVLPAPLVIRGSTGLPPKLSAALRRRKRGATDRRH